MFKIRPFRSLHRTSHDSTMARSVRCDDHLDTSQGSGTALEERASDQQILQFVTSYQCAWIDKYLSTISSVMEDPTMIVQVAQTLGKNEHLLVQHLFSAHVTRIVDRNPTLPPGGRFVPQDQARWESLDERIPFQETGEYLFPPEASAGLETPTPAAITYDVDSVIVYGDNIPLAGSLDIRAVPNPKSTFRKTNHIATSIEGKRVPLSSIPNFRLGFSSRVSVQMMFPSLYIQSVTPTPNINLTNQGLIWDELVLTALQAANSAASNLAGPGRWSWELERHKQKAQALSYSNNQHLLSSRDIPHFVQAMRDFTQDPSASEFVRARG
ncbi:hypothetical protein QFC24_005290 [Naganishia onofrii]|uniref:Uncharacterized protein n=1 Tax=Naganishia onofrii TaxID=1851511 RepID=A0ACC2X9Q4_9TREE|nr:hypothetical protein QFC24_005290 [Naganishia onofrii]